MRTFAMSLLTVTLSASCLVQLGKDLGDVSQPRGISATEGQVTNALREALTASIGEAVRGTSQPNGFWNNQEIRILLPPKMEVFEKGLRMAGQGLRIENFELSMNRAAEMASASAGPSLQRQAADLNFRDGRSVLNGTSTATTDYFRTAAYAELTKTLRPTVEIAMAKMSVVHRYNYLAMQTKGLTLGQPFEFDITGYVVKKTLDGILQVAGNEEAKIRANPEAQRQPLLREVFKH